MPHAYRALVEREMTRLGWSQAQLAANSGLSKQVVNKIVKDERAGLTQRPDLETVEGLAKAFDIDVEVVWLSVAQALGIPIGEVPDVVRMVEDASNEELLRVLKQRLQKASEEREDSSTSLDDGFRVVDATRLDGEISEQESSRQAPEHGRG